MCLWEHSLEASGQEDETKHTMEKRDVQILQIHFLGHLLWKKKKNTQHQIQKFFQFCLALTGSGYCCFSIL